MFVSPPGRVANWTNWTLLGLRKSDWNGLHVWFGTVFLGAAILHLILNWRPLMSYFKNKIDHRVGFRLEWVVALAFSVVVFGGIRAAVPPFSTFLAFNESVKESWDKPAERAPIPHAELLPVGELAQKAAVDWGLALSRLNAAGISNATPEVLVGKLAERNRISGQQVYQVLVGERTALGAGSGGPAAHSERGGGGPGRKTLVQYCAEEQLNVTNVLARLKEKRIRATESMTLREVAAENGYERPYEILELIKSAGK